MEISQVFVSRIIIFWKDVWAAVELLVLSDLPDVDQKCLQRSFESGELGKKKKSQHEDQPNYSYSSSFKSFVFLNYF